MVSETIMQTRLCPQCETEKAITLEHWPAKSGKPDASRLCRLCTRLNKRDYDKALKARRVAARTKNLAALAAMPDPRSANRDKLVPATRDRRDGEPGVKHLSVARALREGADVLNKHSRYILSRFLRYVRDENSPHHEWAMKLAMANITPKKLYEDFGLSAAGGKPGRGSREGGPVVHIHVAPVPVAGAGEPTIRVIEHDNNERSDGA